MSPWSCRCLLSSVVGLSIALLACGNVNVGDAPGGASSGPGTGSTSGGGAPASGDSGSVGGNITLSTGQVVEVVLWAVTGPSGSATVVQSGSVDVQNSAVASFYAANIPAGSGYRVQLSATAIDASVVCAGSAGFDIAARQTTRVSVSMACNVATSGALVTRANGMSYNCAAVDRVGVAPMAAEVGASVAASVTAMGPDATSLKYAWSATSGSFDDPTSATPHFTCAAPGTATLTVTASDGPIPAGSSCALSTGTATVSCEAAVDAGTDAGGDAGVDAGTDAGGDAGVDAGTDAGGDAGTDGGVIVTAAPALPPWGLALLGLTMLGAGSRLARSHGREHRKSSARSGNRSHRGGPSAK
jgi:hypothetical protein